jgi:hypothetical protein
MPYHRLQYRRAIANEPSACLFALDHANAPKDRAISKQYYRKKPSASDELREAKVISIAMVTHAPST